MVAVGVTPEVVGRPGTPAQQLTCGIADKARFVPSIGTVHHTIANLSDGNALALGDFPMASHGSCTLGKGHSKRSLHHLQ